MSEGKQRIMRARDKLLRKPDNPYKKERQLIQNNINKTFRDIRDCLFGTYLTNSQIEKVVKESEEKKNEKQCESEKGSELPLVVADFMSDMSFVYPVDVAGVSAILSIVGLTVDS